MKTILSVSLFSAVVIAATATAQAQQLVKCVSKDGKVEYARDCPPGTTEQKTNIRSSSGGSGAASPPPAQKTVAEQNAAFKKRQIEQQEAENKDAKKLQEAQARREACENAQNYVKTLEAGTRITKTDPKTGERIFIEDAERNTELTKARQRVSDTCK